jgi:hypothetical protein
MLKTMILGDVMTVQNETKYIKMVVRTVPDSVSLILDRASGPHSLTPRGISRIYPPMKAVHMLSRLLHYYIDVITLLLYISIELPPHYNTFTTLNT